MTVIRNHVLINVTLSKRQFMISDPNYTNCNYAVLLKNHTYSPFSIALMHKLLNTTCIHCTNNTTYSPFHLAHINKLREVLAIRKDTLCIINTLKINDLPNCTKSLKLSLKCILSPLNIKPVYQHQ